MKAFFAAALCGLVVALAGCEGREGGLTRGLFTGYVQDKTEEEVIAQVGKPDSIDASTQSTPKWVYKRKTFDPDNNNQVDPETVLLLQKDPAGKMKVVQVIFR